MTQIDKEHNVTNEIEEPRGSNANISLVIVSMLALFLVIGIEYGAPLMSPSRQVGGDTAVAESPPATPEDNDSLATSSASASASLKAPNVRPTAAQVHAH